LDDVDGGIGGVEGVEGLNVGVDIDMLMVDCKDVVK